MFYLPKDQEAATLIDEKGATFNHIYINLKYCYLSKDQEVP